MASPIEVPATKTHTATVIVAHGLGDTGSGWKFLAQQWRLQKKFDYVKFIFPTAPRRSITLNMGMEMNGWYDIKSLGEDIREHDKTNVLASREIFRDLIAKEIESGIPADRIVLGGFSQGGAMALFSALTYPKKLAGVFGLSCYLLLPQEFAKLTQEVGDANKDTKVFMAHGDADMIVQYKFGQMSAEGLRDLGYEVEFKTYPGMPHSADEEEIAEVAKYLDSVIPDKTL